MSWPSSPPVRRSTAMPWAEAAALSSRTRSGRSETSVTKSPRTCGVATTVPVPSSAASRSSSTLSSSVSGPSSSP